MHLNNSKRHTKFQGHWSKVNVTGLDLRILYHCDIRSRCYWLLLVSLAKTIAVGRRRRFTVSIAACHGGYRGPP